MTPYYQDDYVTIYHGDCREALSGDGYDCIITDPPYGLNRPYGRANEVVEGDADTDLADWLALNHCVETPSVLFAMWQWFPPIAPARQLVWSKGQLGLSGSALPWLNSHEVAWVFGHGWVESPKRGTVFTASRDVLAQHPTQKPIEVMQWIVGAAQPMWTVIDPFMGSGTTLVAAKNLGRRAIGIEIEERYCEIAANRCIQGVLDFGGAA